LLEEKEDIMKGKGDRIEEKEDLIQVKYVPTYI